MRERGWFDKDARVCDQTQKARGDHGQNCEWRLRLVFGNRLLEPSEGGGVMRVVLP